MDYHVFFLYHTQKNKWDEITWKLRLNKSEAKCIVEEDFYSHRGKRKKERNLNLLSFEENVDDGGEEQTNY